MNYIKTITPIVLLIILLGCNKDPEQVGCTDPVAVNYDPQALKEDGTCSYNDAAQIIWNQGESGGWNGNLTEGAYDFLTCYGAVSERINEVDSMASDTALVFINDENGNHRSYFTLINTQEARDFAEGSLRFDCRIPEGGAPKFVNVFIGGSITQTGGCEPFRRSDFVEISTQSFNDSLFTPVQITIRNFAKIQMANVNVVFGLDFQSDSIVGLEVNNIRWSANRVEE